ncbi:MAG: O-antigen ligase family protein [Lachnospiraceae bacterium]|nr:O-antigen ligase family protein [Lachnospiraceae bacterium]
MGKKANPKTHNKMLALPVAFLPFAMGLSWHYLMYAAGILFWGMLLYECRKNKALTIRFDIGIIGMLGFFCCVLLCNLFAADHEGALAGTLRWLCGAGFLLLLMQKTGDAKANEAEEDLFAYLPASACIMLIVCMVCYPAEGLRNVFFYNGRLSGFFGYPNTCGLFYLLAIAKLSAQGARGADLSLKKEAGQKQTGLTNLLVIQMILLLAGLLWTGSRTTFVLFLLYLVYQTGSLLARHRKAAGKNGLLTGTQKPTGNPNRFGHLVPVLCSVAALLAVFGYVWLTKDLKGFGRLLRISLTEKDLLERLLFWRDALFMVKDHPFGVGFGGYHALRPLYQSGAYMTRYVHNDWLQIVVDYGILAGGCMVFALIRGAFHKPADTEEVSDGGKSGGEIGEKEKHQVAGRKENRELLCLLALHLLFDFDLQFGCVMIWLIALLYEASDKSNTLTWRWGYSQRKLSGKTDRADRTALIVRPALTSLCILCIGSLSYFGLSDLCLRCGDAGTAYRINPMDSEAADEVMTQLLDHAQAADIAERVLVFNPYDKTAWRMKAYAAYEAGQYEDMKTALGKTLDLEPYNAVAYEDAIELCYAAMRSCEKAQQIRRAAMLRDEILAIDNLRRQRKKNVSTLAILAKDRPDLRLSEADRTLLQNLK